MAPIRVRIRTLIIVIPVLAILEAFFRPEANRDPVYLSVMYGTMIVAGLVGLLIYAISLLDFSGPISKEGQSLNLEAGVELKRGVEETVG